MSVFHEHGLTPFPFTQCWNMARQHASGSPQCLESMMSSCVPASSKSKSIPTSCQLGASLLIIWIFFPPAPLSTDNLASVGEPSSHRRKLHQVVWLNHDSVSSSQLPVINISTPFWGRRGGNTNTSLAASSWTSLGVVVPICKYEIDCGTSSYLAPSVLLQDWESMQQT